MSKKHPPLTVNCPHRHYRHGHRSELHVRNCGLQAAGWRWVPRKEAIGEPLADEAELAKSLGVNIERTALRLVKAPHQGELFA